MTTPACQRERGRLTEVLKTVRVGAGLSELAGEPTGAQAKPDHAVTLPGGRAAHAGP